MILCVRSRECNYSYNFHHGVAVYRIYADSTDEEHSEYGNNDDNNRHHRYTFLRLAIMFCPTLQLIVCSMRLLLSMFTLLSRSD